MAKKVIIASDHGGLRLKKVLVEAMKGWGIDVEDLGPDCEESCDYPPFARKVTDRIVGTDPSEVLGILICGSGIGMCMTANHVHGIRAAMATNEYMARKSREHNNANVLCLGERVTGEDVALDMVKIFLETKFEGGRHERRVNLIEGD